MKITPMPAINNPGGLEFHISFTREERVEMIKSEADFKRVLGRAISELSMEVAQRAVVPVIP